jgi:hypothetical protein
MKAATSYDEIGQGYAQLRRPDPRIAAAIEAALGDAASVVNVGARTGSNAEIEALVTCPWVEFRGSVTPWAALGG